MGKKKWTIAILSIQIPMFKRLNRFCNHCLLFPFSSTEKVGHAAVVFKCVEDIIVVIKVYTMTYLIFAFDRLIRFFETECRIIIWYLLLVNLEMDLRDVLPMQNGKTTISLQSWQTVPFQKKWYRRKMHVAWFIWSKTRIKHICTVHWNKWGFTLYQKNQYNNGLCALHTLCACLISTKLLHRYDDDTACKVTYYDIKNPLFYFLNSNLKPLVWDLVWRVGC